MRDGEPGLATFLVDVAKCLTGSELRERRFVLALRSRGYHGRENMVERSKEKAGGRVSCEPKAQYTVAISHFLQ